MLHRTSFWLPSLLVYAVAALGQDVPARALIPSKPIGSGNIRQLTYSPNGQILGVVTTVGFQIRNADSGRVLNSIVDNLPEALRSQYYSEPWLSELSWSPDGKRIARAVTGIEIRDPLGSAPERTLAAGATDKAFHQLAWSPAGKRIAARSNLGIVVWNLSSGRRFTIPVKSPCPGCDAGGAYAWSPDGGRLALVLDLDSEVIDIWDVDRRQRVQRIGAGIKLKSYFRQDTSDNAIQINPNQSEIEWSPDGRVLARYSSLSGLTLWDVAAGSLMRQMQPPEKMVSLSWSRDSKLLRMGTVHQFQFLSPDTGTPAFVLKSGEGDQWMRSSAVSVNGERMAASLDDGEILLWKIGDHRSKVRVQTGLLADTRVMLSPDLKQMAAESWQDWAGVWDLSTGAKLKAFEAVHVGYGQYVWSPDGQTLAILHAATHPQTLELLQPSSLQPSRIVKLPELNAFGYLTSWSPDGSRILVNGKEPIVVSVENGAIEAAPRGGGLLLWTAQGGLKPLPIPVRAFLQAPDCRLVALLQDYDHLVVWDTQENRVLWTVIVPPERAAGELAWSPDSQRLAFVSKPGSVDIWDRSTGRVLDRLTTPGTWPWIGPSYLIWREKLVAVIRLGGAVQLWREP